MNNKHTFKNTPMQSFLLKITRYSKCEKTVVILLLVAGILTKTREKLLQQSRVWRVDESDCVTF